MEHTSLPSRFSSSVSAILRQAGWFEGRDVSGSPSLMNAPPPFLEAAKVLNEFAGLHVGTCGPGVDFATSDIEINPELGSHLTDELKNQERDWGVQLYPLGEIHNGHGYIIIDDYGRIYIVSDTVERFAPSFVRAIEMLLLGKAAAIGEIAAAWRQPPGSAADGIETQIA